jgi:hypothetical protein
MRQSLHLYSNKILTTSALAFYLVSMPPSALHRAAGSTEQTPSQLLRAHRLSEFIKTRSCIAIRANSHNASTDCHHLHHMAIPMSYLSSPMERGSIVNLPSSPAFSTRLSRDCDVIIAIICAGSHPLY